MEQDDTDARHQSTPPTPPPPRHLLGRPISRAGVAESLIAALLLIALNWFFLEAGPEHSHAMRAAAWTVAAVGALILWRPLPHRWSRWTAAIVHLALIGSYLSFLPGPVTPREVALGILAGSPAVGRALWRELDPGAALSFRALPRMVGAWALGWLGTSVVVVIGILTFLVLTAPTGGTQIVHSSGGCITPVGATSKGVARSMTDAIAEAGHASAGWQPCGHGSPQMASNSGAVQLVDTSDGLAMIIARVSTTSQVSGAFIAPEIIAAYDLQPSMKPSGAPPDGARYLDLPEHCGHHVIERLVDSTGATLGFTVWSHVPAPADNRLVDAWYVPAAVANALVQEARLHHPVSIAPAGEAWLTPEGLQQPFEGLARPVVVPEDGSARLAPQDVQVLCSAPQPPDTPPHQVPPDSLGGS